jgi:transketolase
VLRPADARETVGAWRHAIERTDGPTLLALSRQNLEVLENSSSDEVARGAYVVVDEEDPDVVLVATGSEVGVAVAAADVLADSDIAARVVSMPSWELFEDQDDEYQDELLPSDVPVISVEAASTFGWDRWADDTIGIDTFGESAPGAEVLAHFGFTPDGVADAVLEFLDEE